MEIKKIPVELTLYEYLFTFEYETYKGYRREQQRVIKHFDKQEAKKCFNEWSKSIRTMTNVKILGIVEKSKENINV